ncbi:MAG: SGNH/GDSL hydrolase family protein [Clostridia bacterium]|nr:SGNH/GDSL hydrolase family protein [Clostridia bacterium]
MMKKVSRLLALMLTGSLLCVGGAAAESVFTQEMVERSLTAVGNTERLHRAIDKAQRGEKVTIAYLGGSITEGALAQPQTTKCYAYLSAQIFAEKYMPDAKQLTYVNAGISGTPSLLGITRLEQDVLRKKPDVVFVEFAVNDSNDMVSRGVYESLVRKLLMSETQPAVILIFTLLDSGYSCQSHMQQVGKHYDLGMISVRDAIQPQIDLGKMTWRDYSTDYAHPTNEGHAFIAGLIGHYFDNAVATPPVPYAMPDNAKYGKALETLQNVRKGDAAIVSEGSFPFGPASCYSYKQGWRHLAAKGGTEPMVLELTCSHLTLAFKQEKTQNCGKAEIWVDGVLKKTLSGYAANAWGNVVTELIDLGDSAPHTIEIRMAEGDEKKTFNLLDIGYVP